VFAVPKTQCALVPEKSKVIQKKDKIVIHLAKVNPRTAGTRCTRPMPWARSMNSDYTNRSST
jgi:hypothetical protein